MDPKEVRLLDYDPIPQLVTKVTEVKKAKVPAIDGHNHLGKLGNDAKAIADYVSAMDECNVRAVVDLDGGWGDVLAHRLKAFSPYIMSP